jgi:hypothetical protein
MHEAKIDHLYQWAFECHRRANQQKDRHLSDLWEGVAQNHIQTALRIAALDREVTTVRDRFRKASIR